MLRFKTPQLLALALVALPASLEGTAKTSSLFKTVHRSVLQFFLPSLSAYLRNPFFMLMAGD